MRTAKRRVSRIRHPRRSRACADQAVQLAAGAAQQAYRVTARAAWTTGTQRNGATVDPGVICAGMPSSDCGKQQVAALAARPADLREQERLDTRAMYLNQGCFRRSRTRSA